jgi:hypothetical protein
MGEMHTGVWYGDMMGRDHSEDLGLDGRIILKLIFKEWNGDAWTGFLWLRTATGGGRFQIR